ncbi:hypothetical protein [Vibrio sp. HN007]|uniref:hypothetical protein n=1 Tax=Vibrio iocasae TaxID=3098914 RepID=UPI0035D4B232
MKTIHRWILIAVMPLVILFSHLVYAAESMHFSTGVYEGDLLVLRGVNFTPFGSVEIEITDPQNGTLNYIESANEKGSIEINLVASDSGTYKASVISGSESEVVAYVDVFSIDGD